MCAEKTPLIAYFDLNCILLTNARLDMLSVSCDNNNNNKHDNVYGAVIMAEPLREFTRFI